jgi:hypothetical protein
LKSQKDQEFYSFVLTTKPGTRERVESLKRRREVR